MNDVEVCFKHVSSMLQVQVCSGMFQVYVTSLSLSQVYVCYEFMLLQVDVCYKLMYVTSLCCYKLCMLQVLCFKGLHANLSRA
mgnify:CR=1 FL=1